MAHQRTVTKNRYIFSIIKAKKIHILYAYTGDQNKNGKRWVLGGGGLRADSGDFWHQHWQVRSLNLPPPDSDLPCVTSLFSSLTLPPIHILIGQAQSLSITQQCHCKLAIQPDSTCFLTGSPTGIGITEKTKRWWSKLASVVHLWDNICERVYWYVCMPCKSNYTHNPLWRHKRNYKSPSLNI